VNACWKTRKVSASDASSSSARTRDASSASTPARRQTRVRAKPSRAADRRPGAARTTGSRSGSRRAAPCRRRSAPLSLTHSSRRRARARTPALCAVEATVQVDAGVAISTTSSPFWVPRVSLCQPRGGVLYPTGRPECA
jgi:hypothetical protein